LCAAGTVSEIDLMVFLSLFWRNDLLVFSFRGMNVIEKIYPTKGAL